MAALTPVLTLLLAVHAVSGGGLVGLLASSDAPFALNVSVDLGTEVRTFVAQIKDRMECENHGVDRSTCLKCMDPDDILSLLKLDPSSKSLSRSSAQDVSVFLSHQILYFESMCVSGKKGCDDIRDCQEDVLKVMGRYSSPRESLLNILRMFKMYLKEEPGKECFSAEDVLNELPSNYYEYSQVQFTRQLFATVMRKIYEGLCIEIGESVTDFVDDIFHHYGDKCSPYMTLNGLKRVIHDLKSGSGKEHDHDHNHAHHHDHEHDHSHEECDHGHGHSAHSHSHDHDHDHGVSHSHIRYIQPNHDHSHSHDHDHNHYHPHAHDHDHPHNHDHDHPHNHDHDHDHPHNHDHDHSHDYDYSKFNESKSDNNGNLSSLKGNNSNSDSIRQNGSISSHEHNHDHSHDHDHHHNVRYESDSDYAKLNDSISSHNHDHDHGHNHAHSHNESKSDFVKQNDSAISHNHNHGHDHNHDHDHGHNHDHNHNDDHSHSHASKPMSTQRPTDTTSSQPETIPTSPKMDPDSSTTIETLPETTTTSDSFLETKPTTSESLDSTERNMSPSETPSSLRRKRRSMHGADEDFNGPFASLRSQLSHQEDRPKEEDEEQSPPDDVKKVYLLQYDDHHRNIDLELSGTPHQFASMAKKCLSAEELLLKFGYNENSTLTKSDFTELCPALIQQIVSGVCTETKKLPSLMPSRMETYGYGSLSVFVISLTSLAGVLLLPIMTKHAYNYIISGFYGLAFSTLAADAMLHLMPQFLGLHNHGSGDDHAGHSHDHGEFLEPYAQLMLGMFFTVYGLFLFEAVMCAFNKSDHQEGSKGGHGHSHAHLPDQLPTLISVKTKSETQLPVSRDQSSSSLDTEIVEVEAMKKPPNLMVNKPIFLGMTSLAIVVTLGDSIHNFGDGLAIGAAFSTGIRGGLSTAIAVFCHELPHEFGDFVVLLSTGLSFSRALLINFLSGLTCFAGLYIGILIGDDELARKWVMAVTAGIFLYVALAEMLPELRAHHHGSRIKMLLVKNLGILAGIGIMLLISIYEEKFA